MKPYDLNDEISAYLKKKMQWQLFLLIFLLIFLLFNFFIYRYEKKLQTFSEEIGLRQTQDELREEYIAALQTHLFLDEKSLAEHMEFLESFRFDEISFQDHTILLKYSNVGIKEMEEEILRLKEKYMDVQIQRIDENGEEKQMVIEVRI